MGIALSFRLSWTVFRDSNWPSQETSVDPAELPVVPEALSPPFPASVMGILSNDSEKWMAGDKMSSPLFQAELEANAAAIIQQDLEPVGLVCDAYRSTAGRWGPNGGPYRAW